MIWMNEDSEFDSLGVRQSCGNKGGIYFARDEERRLHRILSEVDVVASTRMDSLPSLLSVTYSRAEQD